MSAEPQAAGQPGERHVHTPIDISSSPCALIALAGNGLLLLAQDNLADPDLAKGMINAPAEQAIREGLAYRGDNQHDDGSWGNSGQFGSVAITSLCGLAFMAADISRGVGNMGKMSPRRSNTSFVRRISVPPPPVSCTATIAEP